MAGVIRRAWGALTFEVSWLAMAAWKRYADIEKEDTNG